MSVDLLAAKLRMKGISQRSSPSVSAGLLHTFNCLLQPNTLLPFTDLKHSQVKGLFKCFPFWSYAMFTSTLLFIPQIAVRLGVGFFLSVFFWGGYVYLFPKIFWRFHFLFIVKNSNGAITSVDSRVQAGLMDYGLQVMHVWIVCTSVIWKYPLSPCPATSMQRSWASPVGSH